MARIAEALSRHALVGIDTSVFIYHLEAAGDLAHVAGDALECLSQGAFQGITSVITLMELWVRPMALQQPQVAREYDVLLANYPNLTIAEVDRDVAWKAAELRATHRIRPADAIQIAACIDGGATAFLTNDRDLRRVDLLEVLLLEDFV